jgi:molecular chaperone DnaK
LDLSISRSWSENVLERGKRSPDRIAIDFGTSNTVISAWNEELGRAETLELPEWSRTFPADGNGGCDEELSVIPSLIHFASSGEQWIGCQVEERNLAESSSTVRWMKHYLASQSPVRLTINGSPMSYFEAGESFLRTVLAYLLEWCNSRGNDAELVFTVPVEAGERYGDWICSVAEKVRITRFRLIDEASAAALAYQVRLGPGDSFMVFDLGGGTLDISVVAVDVDPSDPARRRCRVLGKAGDDLGGMHIDKWMVQEVQKRAGDISTDRNAHFSRALLVGCEKAKELLSFRESVYIGEDGSIPELGEPVLFTRNDLESLLDDHEFFSRIHSTIQHAMNGAISRGYTEDRIRAVVMVGGCSAIPSIQSTLRRRFGNTRVCVNRPLDAVARGAAAFAAGMGFSDHIQHDYAIKFWNSARSCHEFRTIVNRGAPYPSTSPVATLRIRGTYDGQTQFGIPVYEIGENGHRRGADNLEIVADSSGSMKLVEMQCHTDESRIFFWMNENNPTFLVADPPAVMNEARFELAFAIDGNKRLLVTARDMKTGLVVNQDHPITRLI